MTKHKMAKDIIFDIESLSLGCNLIPMKVKYLSTIEHVIQLKIQLSVKICFSFPIGRHLTDDHFL